MKIGVKKMMHTSDSILGIMCQIGEKIEAECKICGNRKRCEEAGTKEALKCKRIQVILSDKENAKRNVFEERIRFESDFCSQRCPDIYSCNHRYQAAKCEVLFNALVEKGFITEQLVKEVKKEKVVQFPVDMDEMQRNILVELLNARKECTDQNLLTVRGCVAIIDALFYLVKEKPIWMGVDKGDSDGDRTGGFE